MPRSHCEKDSRLHNITHLRLASLIPFHIYVAISFIPLKNVLGYMKQVNV